MGIFRIIFLFQIKQMIMSKLFHFGLLFTIVAAIGSRIVRQVPSQNSIPKLSLSSLNSMKFQKCYSFHCSKCTKSILFQKEDSARRKCSQLLRMPNCCQKFLRGTLDIILSYLQ